MNAEELSMLIVGKAAVQVSQRSLDGFSRIGYAIPIPKDTPEEAMMAVDQELSSLYWTFERLRIQGQEHYVLFP